MLNRFHLRKEIIIVCLLMFTAFENLAFGQDPKPIVFARDIAPILVANCLECHNDRQTRGSFSIATPQKLMSGGETGQAIEPGNSGKSLLVRHIRGDEQPRMPNNRRPLTEKTIENIARWVDSGAKLDEGQSMESAIQQLAWSADQIARDRLTRLSAAERTAEEREAIAEIMSRIRPNSIQSDEKTINHNAGFCIIGLSEQSVTDTVLSSLEKAKADLIELLNPADDHQMRSPGRTLVFVFQRAAEFVEFQRQNGFESTVNGITSVGRLRGEWPMIGLLVAPEALDPDNLQMIQEKSSPRSKSRSRSRSNSSVTEMIGIRSADSLAVEAYTKAVMDSYTKAPAWLKIGIPQVMGRVYNPDLSYYQMLLSEAKSAGPGKITGGWDQRSAAFLKDQLPPQVSGPLAYSLMEWLKSTQNQKLAGFVQSVTEGESALDEALNKSWRIDRKVFLSNWTNWLMRAGSGTSRKGR